jgi:tRNA(Ile)-lysidine synthase
MKGRKKLSKFFKDEKLDTISKEKQWLLCSGADIVWVMGRRADQRFSVTPGTRNILKFTLLQ